MAKPTQPISVDTPTPGKDPKDVIPIEKYLDLLKEEEDYWDPEQSNTKIIISRLRKIFYDQWGWNTELIRGAANVETRYKTVMKQASAPNARELSRHQGLEYTPVYRQITYTNKDRVYGSSREGEVPYIYQDDHQEVRLKEGEFCDIAHVLAGLDALNHKQVVTPLPDALAFLYRLFPYVRSNADVVTWIGDIASSAADLLFDYIRNSKKQLTPEQQQKVINSDASGADMLGDIDPYVIARHYPIQQESGQRLTEMLKDYYLEDHSKRQIRYAEFADIIGLKGWDGQQFSNEKQWLKYYYGQLKNCICFVIFSQNEKSLKGFILPLKVWLGGYKKIVKITELLTIFLDSLKREINLNSTKA